MSKKSLLSAQNSFHFPQNDQRSNVIIRKGRGSQEPKETNIINYQEKEIQRQIIAIFRLKQLNTYLQHSVEHREVLIEKERIDHLKLKNLLTGQIPYLGRTTHQSQTNTDHVSKPRTNSMIDIQSFSGDVDSTGKKSPTKLFDPQESAMKGRSATKNMTYFQKLVTLMPVNSPTADEKQEKQVHDQKDQPKPFVASDENLKLHTILDLGMSDEEAVGQYNSDSNIQFVSALLGDEDRFLSLLQKSSYQKLSFIYERLKKLLTDHRQIFNLLLRLKTLIKAAFQITQSLVLDEALERIVEQTATSLGCDRSSCFVADRSKGELWSKVAKGMSTVIRIPMNKGVAGHVATAKEVVNIRNAYSDHRFNKDVDSKSNYKTRTILAAPITDNDQCLGVLQCINKFEGYFSQEDEALLKILCDFSKIVLNHTMNNDQQLVTHNKLRLTIRNGIHLQKNFRLVQFKEAIQQSEKNLRNIMSTEQTRVVIRSHDEAYFFDEEGKEHRVNKNTGIINEAINTKRQVNIFNASKHPQFCPVIDIDTSLPIICIPIMFEEQTLGGIMVVNVKGLATLQKLTQNHCINIKQTTSNNTDRF